jgi:hypothetical protein
MISNPPELAVVLMVDQQRARGALALQSILAQSMIAEMEVLLFDRAHAERGPLPGADHPQVRLFDLPRSIGFGAARAQAVELACAPLVAFVEEHVTAFPGWAEAVCQAHQGPWVGVGPEVHFANPGQGDSDLVDLRCQGPWSPPAKEGETPLIRGQNSSFRRDVLLRYREQLPLLLNSDRLLIKKLMRDGYRCYMAPAAKVAHASESRLRTFCRGGYLGGVLHIASQAQYFQWTTARRLAYMGAALLLPVLGPSRIIAAATRRHPALLGKMLRNLPSLVLIDVYSAAGFWRGLSQGVGDSAEAFLEYELNQYRGIAGITEAGEP